tara:strand:+ start:3727 stop:4707 length:981 start_codon:yes stop_codon:yes gene_type:complete
MKESEIRPKNIFNEYLRLAKIDAKTYFINSSKVEIDCPACGRIGEHSFHKENFDYSECPNCNTLYVNPRPDAESFFSYYRESPSSKFWATTFYAKTAEARRKKLWKPKARAVYDIISKYTDRDNTVVVDIGGGYGIFAEEIRKFMRNQPIVIEPGPHLASICRDKDLNVIEKFLENVKQTDLPKNGKAYVSFELFEHLHSPESFMRHLNRLMSPGDLFIFTTLSGAGVDIQALWENSDSVMPPHHLNFLNPFSVRILLDRCSFETLEVTTPGKLDIDILTNNKDKIKDRFWKNFTTYASDNQKKIWQKLISESGLSSHMMVVCKKP